MKEIKCEILDDFGNIDENEHGCIKLCTVKWNGKEPRGYDIRKYDKENDRLTKGVIISYDGMDELLQLIIENGLCDLTKLKAYIRHRESQMITSTDFDNMFTSVNNELTNYERDKYGNLLNDDGQVLIKRGLKYGR